MKSDGKRRSRNRRRAERAPSDTAASARDRRWALRWSYFFLVLFAIFFLMPPFYMLITSLKSKEEIRRHHQSVVGLLADALELHRAADAEPVPDLLPQLGAGVDLRGDRHHADQRDRRLLAGPHEVLGLGGAGDRRVPDLPDPGHAAVHPAVQDVRVRARDHRHRADEPLVDADASSTRR